MKINDGGLLKSKPLTTGHCFGELWGLASHPVDPNLFVTSGDDKTVRMWNIERATSVAITVPDSIPDVCRSVAFTPAPGNEGEYLAVGLGGRLASVSDENPHSGKVMVSAAQLLMLFSAKISRLWILFYCCTDTFFLFFSYGQNKIITRFLTERI
jgi:WD40 repeat protein